MFTSPALADNALGTIPDTWYELSTDSERTFCGAGAQFFNGVYLHTAYIAEIGEWVIVFGSESWQFQNGSRYCVFRGFRRAISLESGRRFRCKAAPSCEGFSVPASTHRC